MNTKPPSEIDAPNAHEVQAAVHGREALRAFLATRLETQHIQIFDEQHLVHKVELPTSALRLLDQILAELAQGHAVKVVPVHTELTTQEAADMLNISRPHLIKLLDRAELPFHKTGKHRRIKFADVQAYKDTRDQASEDAMAALAQQAQELRMGYE